MTTRRPLVRLVLLGAAAACGSVPDDPATRTPPSGAIRGTIVYQGQRPCSRDGHVVGGAVVLVFDQRDPPPPGGLATTALTFATVTGDVLFADEPRYTGSQTYCPLDAGFTETVTASAPFEIAPIQAAGSYLVKAMYDYTGDFLPEFSIRNLPEQGDVVGGAIDTADAVKPVNAGNPNYRPIFVPVVVGVPQASSASGAPGYALPPAGFVADNVTVTIAAPVPTPRPYFYPQGERVSFDPATGTVTASVTQSSDQKAADLTGIAGAAESDPGELPILTVPQDVAVLAPPMTPSPQGIGYYESSLPHLRLEWGVPAAELPAATAAPFQLQVAPFGQGPHGAGFLVWQDAIYDAASAAYAPRSIPEGLLPQLWPRVVLTRLPDAGAASPGPLVLMQAITLLGGAAGDSLLGTAAAAAGSGLFDPSAPGGARPRTFAQDHLAVVLRPSVFCLPSPPDPGVLVVSHLSGTAADVDCSSGACVPSGAPDQPIAPPTLASDPSVASLAAEVKQGCLPTGRYAIDVVYADGQAWTTPNEAGICSAAELSADGSSCARPVLDSQGRRAVVEVVPALDPAYCVANPVPDKCLTGP